MILRKIKYPFIIAMTVIINLAPVNLWAQDHGDEIFQYSTKHAFSIKDFEGTLSYSMLNQKGNFGLGTFNSLNGEMVALDGKFYQIDHTGKVSLAEPDDFAPYVTLKFFAPDMEFNSTEELSLDELKQVLLDEITNPEIPVAVKIFGNFKHIKTRSVKKQTKPYPSLEEIVAGQSVFNFENISGTIIGFWFPDFYDGVNFSGFHFHFLTEDKSGGGHLLDCSTQDILCEIDESSGVIISY